MKIMIGMASFCDIAEKACKVYRRELFEAEDMDEVKCVFYALEDVMRLWTAASGFDCEDDLILTIERREEEKDGERNENMVKEAKWTWE